MVNSTVYCEDDTILFATSPNALNELLAHIEDSSEQYGLKINRGKCHSMHMYENGAIHFKNGDPSSRTHDATYLGNKSNHAVNIARSFTAYTGHPENLAEVGPFMEL